MRFDIKYIIQRKNLWAGNATWHNVPKLTMQKSEQGAIILAEELEKQEPEYRYRIIQIKTRPIWISSEPKHIAKV